MVDEKKKSGTNGNQMQRVEIVKLSYYWNDSSNPTGLGQRHYLTYNVFHDQVLKKSNLSGL